MANTTDEDQTKSQSEKYENEQEETGFYSEIGRSGVKPSEDEDSKAEKSGESEDQAEDDKEA